MEQQGKKYKEERPIEEIRQQAEALTKQLKLEEKIGMIHGAQLFQTKGVERLGIPPVKMSDGPMGVRQEFEPDSWSGAGHGDDYVTYLPCISALASTWNRTTVREAGGVLGEEARGRGKDIILAPGINLKRSPLCGRNFEYFSEDPYLTGELAVPFIQGIQEWDVAACVKHFAANNQETERLWVDVEIDEDVLRRLYLPAFYEAVTRGGAYTLMGAYNKIYGEHCCQSPFLLKKILREEWGYDGVVISDWGAVHDTQKAALSQLDIEMSVTNDFDSYYLAEPLKKKVEQGEIPEEAIDEKVTRILMLMIRLHMMDGSRSTGAYNTPDHRATALKAARESVVLLKNEKKRLPLKKEGLKRLLVIGDNAIRHHSAGGGSAEIKALYEISPLMGIKTCLGGNTEVTFVPGYECEEEKKQEGRKDQQEENTSWQETSLENGGGSRMEAKSTVPEEWKERRRILRQEAVKLAGEYEKVILIGGLNHYHDSEGNDRADMKLPYGQDELIEEVLKANPQTVVVLLAGSPVEMGSWISMADSVVWSWYAGMEGGTALADVLFGKVNPSGKLPESFYKTHNDCSAHILGQFPGGKSVAYREGLFMGYRYLDKYEIEPEFCFGHGLSYTEFAYHSPQVTVENKEIILSCTIKNTGERDGAEVVQVYAGKKEPEQKDVVQELKGFEKVYLKAGEEQVIKIHLADSSQENMVYRIGSSSRDIRCICNASI